MRMHDAKDMPRTAAEPRRARDARRASHDVRRIGLVLVVRLKLHLLDVMRLSPRCAPWRPGRTLKDLERRSGLLGPASPERAPLLAPVVELLLQDGALARRGGHYRLAAGCAARCPSCGADAFERRPPQPPDDALGAVATFLCTACGAWCGLELPPHERPKAP
jgi:hypothetical protein